MYVHINTYTYICIYILVLYRKCRESLLRSNAFSNLKKDLVAKNIGGDMEEALNTAIHAINFVKSNSVNDRSL